MAKLWGFGAGLSQAIMLSLACSAMAASFPCGDLKDKVLNDGEVYLRSHGSWELVSSNSQLNMGGEGRFIYVIKAPLGSERSGILVVKTGRQIADPKADVPSHKKHVHLERNEVDVSTNKKCAFHPFNPKSVTSKFYDEYHDADYDLRRRNGADALRTFNEFHTNYETVNSGCKRTDDTGWEDIFSLIRRSNRSQYSFDKYVVATGLLSPVFSFFHGSTPQGSVGLADQKVQSIRYKTTDGIACVSIYPPTSQGSFVRVNDLEGRNLVTFLRAGEVEITFSH